MNAGAYQTQGFEWAPAGSGLMRKARQPATVKSNRSDPNCSDRVIGRTCSVPCLFLVNIEVMPPKKSGENPVRMKLRRFIGPSS